MTLTLNKPYFVKRVADNGGTLHFLPVEGFCTGVTLNKPYPAKRVADKEGVLHFLLSNQQLATDGKLVIGKPYFAKRVADKEGVLHFLIDGKQCTPFNPTFCECTICCTLDGTVEIGNGSSWFTAVDVTLTCGGQVPFTTCYSCYNEGTDDTILVNYENYWRGKTTLDVPFDEGPAGSGTYDYYSEVWSSEEFTVDGETYQLHFFAVQVDRHRVLPSPVDETTCGYGWVLKKYDVAQTQWITIMGAGPESAPAGMAGETYFELETNPPYDPDMCPPDYVENGGDCVDPGALCNTAPPGYIASSSGSSAYCDPNDGTYLIVEQKFTGGGPDINCARFSIFDNCELLDGFDELMADDPLADEI